MKFVFAFALLIISTSAIFESGIKQGSLFSTEQLSLLERSPLGRAIVRLAEIQSKSKGADFSALFEAIDQLQSGFQDRKVEENQIFESDQQQYLKDQFFYNNQVTQYKNEAAAYNLDIDDLSNAIQTLKELIAQKNADLQTTTKQLEDHSAGIEKSKKANEESQQDYASVIEAINQATELLNSLENTPSLIQTKKINESGKKLEKAVHKISQKRRGLYQPLVQSLIELKQEGKVDKVFLKRVVDQLTSLKQSFIDSAASQSFNYQRELTLDLEILAEYQAKVNNLKDKQIVELSTEKQDREDENSVKQSLLSQANENLERAGENLEEIEDAWVTRQQTHQNLVADFDKQLQIIDQVLTTLLKGGIRRQ